MSDVERLDLFEAQSGSALAKPSPAPAAAPPAFQRANIFIHRYTDRFLNLWSLLTLVAVTAILLVCIALWDIVWLRPILATAGAGLAAFLGPIPGIIAPEARSKWLITVLVSAIIAAGTWFATKDLESQLKTTDAERAALDARLDAHKDSMVALAGGLDPASQDAVFRESARLLKALQLEHKHQGVLDISLPLLRLRPLNGTALAFTAYAYRSLGNVPEAKKYFISYIATAETVEHATDGVQKTCYDRVDGFCAERTGWIEHRLASIALAEAADATGKDEKLKYLQEAFEHEKRNVELVKWVRPGKDQGFDKNDEEPLSSCAVLQTVIFELAKLGKPADHIVRVRDANLNCG